MSDELPETWPLRPSHSASVAHGLCMAISDLVHHEGGRDVSRRTYLKMCSVATAAELFSAEAARFFGNQRGEDEELLEGIEDRYSNREG